MQLRTVMLATTLSSFSLDALAAAFQLAEHSATGLGRAFAGEAAVADSAAVVARNSALMPYLKGSQLTVVGSYIVPDVSITGQSAPLYSSAAELNDQSIAPEAFVPATFLVTPINKKLSLGFGVFSNFGLSTKFTEDYPAGQLAGTSEITTVNFGANAAFRNGPWSVAVGLNYIYAEADLVRHFGANPLGLDSNIVSLSLEGDDSGYGWNLGMSYRLESHSRFGVHYRSKTEINFDGMYSNQLPATLGGLEGAELPGSLAIELPAIFEFSGAHKINKKWGLQYSLVWTQWSSFQELEAFLTDTNSAVFEKQENFSNSMRFAIGADYKVSSKTKVRFGIAYDESPADPAHLSISIPDTDRVWVSAGATYKLNNTSSIDIGMSILRGKARSFIETDDIGGQWGFESQGNTSIVAMQYNYTFN